MLWVGLSVLFDDPRPCWCRITIFDRPELTHAGLLLFTAVWTVLICLTHWAFGVRVYIILFLVGHQSSISISKSKT